MIYNRPIYSQCPRNHTQFILQGLFSLIVLGSKSPAGLENGDVLSTQITASSKVGDSANGRLYGSSSWCSSTSASSEYLQVDLGRVKTVTGMATQGSPLSDQWVTEYSISFSYRKEQWIPFTAYSSKLKVNHFISLSTVLCG